jgi:hypothetical protein
VNEKGIAAKPVVEFAYHFENFWIKRDRLDRGRAQAEANAFHGDRLGFTLCNGDGTSREREDNFLCLAIPHPACSETLNP